MGQDRAGEMRAVTSGAVLCTRRGGRTSEADRERDGRLTFFTAWRHGTGHSARAGPGPAVRHGTRDSQRGPGVILRRRTAAAPWGCWRYA